MFGVYHVGDIVSYSCRAKSKTLLNMLNSLLFWEILAKKNDCISYSETFQLILSKLS